MWPPGGTLSLTHQVSALAGAFVRTCSPRSHMAMAVQAATCGFQEGARCQIAAGNKLSYLDDHLVALPGSEGWPFKMEQELWSLTFVLVFLRTARFCLDFVEERSFETGSPPFSQIIQHLNKNFFPVSPASALEFAFCGSGDPNFHFCLVTS